MLFNKRFFYQSNLKNKKNHFKAKKKEGLKEGCVNRKERKDR
jgi:hypothetical protein